MAPILPGGMRAGRNRPSWCLGPLCAAMVHQSSACAIRMGSQDLTGVHPNLCLQFVPGFAGRRDIEDDG
jgi:hypothetical protein